MPDTSTSAGRAASRHRTIVLASLLIPLFLFLIVSRGGTQLFVPTPHGVVFNAMAQSLLQGRLDVDPVAIGNEAFIRDGKAFPYFGIFPALIRMPLMLIPGLTGVNFSRLFLWIALSAGALAQIAAVRAAFRPVHDGPAKTMISQRLILASVLAGPPIWLSLVGSVFDEASAWSWALSTTFVALTMHQLTRPQGFTCGPLAAMALVAGCCVLTRPTVGFGLSVALALIMLRNLLQPVEGDSLPRRVLMPRSLVPAMILAAFAIVAMGVNYSRWGNPFVIGDLRLQIHLIAMHPDRLARLEQFGYFNIARLGYGLIYYFAPLWVLQIDGAMLFEERIRTLFDAFEMPPASFFLTDSLTIVLAVLGCFALARNTLASVDRRRALALLTGLSIAPIMMLMAWYMAFRYRLDFVPPLFTLACLGGAAWAQAASERRPDQLRYAELLFAVLLMIQCLSSMVMAALYAMSAFGSPYEYLGGGLIQYYRLMIGEAVAYQ